jgi:uncharacterized spore protein YtfJ
MFNMVEETSKGNNPEQAVETVENTMERLFAGANVKNVYGRPVQQGDTTIISAAEVIVAGGFGVGYGTGVRPEESKAEGGLESGGGGGGGGGGTSQARPVAVINASPEGVRVEPVVDLTKIGLAVITAWGFMLSQVLKMMRRG